MSSRFLMQTPTQTPRIPWADGSSLDISGDWHLTFLNPPAISAIPMSKRISFQDQGDFVDTKRAIAEGLDRSKAMNIAAKQAEIREDAALALLMAGPPGSANFTRSSSSMEEEKQKSVMLKAVQKPSPQVAPQLRKGSVMPQCTTIVTPPWQPGEVEKLLSNLCPPTKTSTSSSCHSGRDVHNNKRSPSVETLTVSSQKLCSAFFKTDSASTTKPPFGVSSASSAYASGNHRSRSVDSFTSAASTSASSFFNPEFVCAKPSTLSSTSSAYRREKSPMRACSVDRPPRRGAGRQALTPSVYMSPRDLRTSTISRPSSVDSRLAAQSPLPRSRSLTPLGQTSSFAVPVPQGPMASTAYYNSGPPPAILVGNSRGITGLSGPPPPATSCQALGAHVSTDGPTATKRSPRLEPRGGPSRSRSKSSTPPATASSLGHRQLRESPRALSPGRAPSHGPPRVPPRTREWGVRPPSRDSSRKR